MRNPFKKKQPTKAVNQHFVDYANTKKLAEFNRYLASVSKYLNNPLSELLKQRGMLLEIYHAHTIDNQKKISIRMDIEKIDKMIERLMRNEDQINITSDPKINLFKL